MIRLALAQLRRRPLRYISLFFSIAIAVALAVATAALSQSLRASIHSLYLAPYESADVVATMHNVTGDQALELKNAAQAAGAKEIALDQQIAGTKRSGAGIYQPIRVGSISPGPLVWQRIIEGRVPEKPGEILVSSSTDSTERGAHEAAAQIGETIYLNISGKGGNTDIPLKVVGQAEPSAVQQLMGTEFAYVNPQDIASWVGESPQLDVELRATLTPGADSSDFVKALQQRAGMGAAVESADSHAAKLENEYLGTRKHFFLLLDAFVAVVVVVAALVIFSSYQVLASQRRREFALIRSIGGTTSQIVGSVVVESAALALLAGAIAVPVGLSLASFVGKHASAVGVRVPLSETSLPPVSTGLVALMGVFVAVGAAFPAALMAARRPVVESLAATGGERTSKIGSAVTVLGGILLVSAGWWINRQLNGELWQDWALSKVIVAAVLAGGLIAIGAMLVIAVVWPILMGVGGRLTPFPVTKLAFSYASKQRLRSGALVAIVFAGTALVGSVTLGQEKIADQLERKAGAQALADVAISSMDGQLPSGLHEKVRGIPGVEAVAPVKVVKLDAPKGKDTNSTGGSKGISGSETAYVIDRKQASEILRDPSPGAMPGEVVLGRYSPWRDLVQNRSKITVTIAGQPVGATVRLADGQFTTIDSGLAERARQSVKEAKLRDAGIDPQDRAAVARLEQATGKIANSYPTTLLLAKIAGSEVVSDKESTQAEQQEAVVEKIRESVSAADNRLVFKDGIADRRASAESVGRVLAVSKLMIVVSLLITTLGVFNVTMQSITERRRDRALLRSIGLGPVRSWILMILEVLMLAGIAAVLGWWVGGALGLDIATTVLA
ncbi:ABC transporter permease [Corynebacterium resistens]|uniref:ABC transporter permease n=1 Tax=Corynebacterium resistens TaxID=258224 RepID=UPI0023573A39|nr:ABC transporter permease [Corynebacterium resistens]